MGAYSSWALLALVHHALIQLAAFECGHQSWFASYRVLGDDVVIADSAVAHAYLELMKALGVEISMNKSLISHKGVFEFAKRVVSPEGDLSGIPIRLVVGIYQYPQDLPDLVLWIKKRGLKISPVSFIIAVQYLLKVPFLNWADTQIGKLPKLVLNMMMTLTCSGYPWWGGIERMFSLVAITPRQLSAQVDAGTAGPTMNIIDLYLHLT